MATTVKIPQHNTPRGTWCQFSGCDSTTGICRMCAPEPSLSEREIAALAVLGRHGKEMAGNLLGSLMCAAGRQTTASAAHQAGAGLTRKGLTIKGTQPGHDRVQYEATNAGCEWIARYREVGGVA